MIDKHSFLQSASTIVTKSYLFLNLDVTPYISQFENVVDYYYSCAKVAGDGSLTDFNPLYGNNFLERTGNNDFVFTSSNGYITGYTIVQKYNRQLSDSEKNYFKQNFIQKNGLNDGSNTVKFGVVYEDIPQTDTYVSLSVEREIDFLDTLTIKNNLKGEWSKFTSTTGVIFGKLQAIQKLKDENGNFITIPLRNVPILVFNKAVNSSTINITNDASQRTPLNMQENSPRDLYFDDFSYNFDKALLPSINSKNVGDVYKYSTITNDNGEFLLTDVPAGLQTVIFEIDLLKQGLSLEEVELNVAPFPKTNQVSVIQSPHLIYREIPVNVENSWGDTLNLGYTRLNVDVNVDLRKWTTYFVPPISLFQKTYDELIQQGYQPNLQISVVDMALRNKDTNAIFSNSSIECVVIDDIKKRDFTRLLGWLNESRQLRDIISFNNLEYNAFKLPANIYDPNGYKRGGDGEELVNYLGIPNQKGVWLSSYEMRVFNTQETIVFRDTGFISVTASVGNTVDATQNKSYYALNTNVLNLTGNTQQGVGTFPFENPWTATYPTPYSIPKAPKILNSKKTFNGSTPTSLIVPRYLDGDMVGLSDADTTNKKGYKYGGWGAQINFSETIFANKFAQQVTTSKLYRYEVNGSYGEEYSNGYTPNNNWGAIPDDQKSIVLNGEHYQRLESGHAYFMWTQGFPRVWNKSTHDEMLPSDFLDTYADTGQTIPIPLNTPLNLPTNSPTLYSYYPSYYKVNSLLLNDTLVASNFDNSSIIKGSNQTAGYVYFYRIIDPDPKKLVPAEPPFIPKYINLNFQDAFIQRGGPSLRAKMVRSSAGRGEQYKFYDFFSAKQNTKDNLNFTIFNRGIVTVTIKTNSGYEIKIEPQKSGNLNFYDIYQTGLQLPTNDDYNSGLNTYNKATYDFGFSNVQVYQPDGSLVERKSINKNGTIYDFGSGGGNGYFKSLNGITGDTVVSGNIPKFYLITQVDNVLIRGPIGTYKPSDIIVDDPANNLDVNAAVFMCTNNSFVNYYEFKTKKADSSKVTNGDDLPYAAN